MIEMNPEIKTIESPYKSGDGEKGEELVAIPALNLDVSLIHMNRSDSQGNGQFLGPDLYFDDLFANILETHRYPFDWNLAVFG